MLIKFCLIKLFYLFTATSRNVHTQDRRNTTVYNNNFIHPTHNNIRKPHLDYKFAARQEHTLGKLTY